ncbi:MAG: rod shape-determining protein MreC [Patescibacteria group bacterium]|nr:rod shape-determining protein MreC [Patescibacteria group bacterium]
MVKLKRKNPFLILLAIFLLIIILHWGGVLQPVERLIFKAIRPLSNDLYLWGNNISASYEERTEKEELLARIEKLEAEVKTLAIDRAAYYEVLSENEKLRKQLDFVDNHNFSTVLAHVIAQEGLFTTAQRRDLIIDKGRQAGLREGLAVISDGGIVIGKIVAVEEESARVCLTTTPGCQLAVSLQNEARTQGLSDGRLGLTIAMDYIPQLEKIAVSDIVITSGLSSEIPRGLVVGKVAEVKSESNEVWQSALIEPLLNFNNLTIVSVVLP